ncbi:MAG: DinB family protein [Nitrolancea sp.]
MKLSRPTPEESPRYYDTYIDLVPDSDLVATLEEQIDATVAALSAFSEEQAQWRPAPGEWNVTEIVGHVSDVERSFAYRALCFARNDPTPLPGVDPDGFMLEAGFSSRPLADVLEELATVRRASITLLRSFDDAAWDRRGTADGKIMSVRALAYVIAGHAMHHALDFPRHRVMGD